MTTTLKMTLRAASMQPTGLDYFRSGRPAKGVVWLTIFFFTFVFYLSPTGSAIAQELPEDELRQQQLEQIKENTSAKKLAHRLHKLQDKVTKELPQARQQREQDAGLWEYITDADDDPVTSDEQAQLADLKTSIEAAYLEAIAEFDSVNQQITDKQLPAVAQARQQQAHSQIETQYNTLRQQLDTLINATDDASKEVALQTLTDNLNQQRFKKPNAPFDPNQLPFGTPSSDVREPGETEADLQAALGLNPHTRYTQIAQTGPVDPQLLSNAFEQVNGPTQADLNPTLDVQITEAIQTLAAELNHNPVEIYTWVHNNIRFIPSYGSIQGSQLTLETKRGNAIDTASLLIALLRASGIPARYAYGTVDIPTDKVLNWVGGVETSAAAQNLMGQGGIPNIGRRLNGVITDIRLEHTWVEAYVDFEPSKGMKNRYGDHWIPMDASFKQYEFETGMDLQTNVPFDAQALVDNINQNATVNETEGWVQNVPQQAIEDQLTQFQQQIEDYINTQNPNATVGEVLGLQNITILPAAPLSAGLPYNMIARQQYFSEVPDNLRHKFEYHLQGELYGAPTGTLLKVEQPTVALAGKKLALSFKPSTEEDEAIINSYLPEPDPVTGEIDPSQLPDSLPGYLINLTAEFTQDGEVQHSINVGTMGTTLYETLGLYSPDKGWRRAVNHPIAGEYRAIGIDLQGSSPERAVQLQQQVEATKAKLESGDETQLATLTRHEVVGDLMYGTIFSYLALNGVQDDISAQSSDIVQYRSPSYGLFGTSLGTQYWFGIPRGVTFAGLVMDVDHYTYQTVNKQNDTQVWSSYNQSVGARASAMEHLVPEQMFSTDAAPAQGISAVKALGIASAEGQKIWTIDQNNLNVALGAINLPSETEFEIRNAVLAGKVATTHGGQINFNGWVGEGYLLIDPNTGAGAYKIAGGSNGGDTILSATANVLVYLSNADSASRSLRFLSGFASAWFGFAGNFFNILDVAGCNEFNAITGAFLANLIGGYLTNLSFLLVAAVVNPILLIVLVIVITQLINYIQSLVVDLVISSCRRRT